LTSKISSRKCACRLRNKGTREGRKELGKEGRKELGKEGRKELGKEGRN